MKYLEDLPFRENRGTKKQVEERKIRKNVTINHATNLYYKLFDSFSKELDPNVQNVNLKWLEKPYDHEKLCKDLNENSCEFMATVSRKSIKINFIKDFVNDYITEKLTKIITSANIKMDCRQ